jgi:hypothetical protein
VKKRAEKKIDFFGIKKRHSKKEKSQFFIGYSESEFRGLSFKKKISSLAHRKVPQICVESAARNTFAARKTLAAHCIMPNTYTSTLSLISSIPPLCQIHLPSPSLLTSSILPLCKIHIPAPSPSPLLLHHYGIHLPAHSPSPLLFYYHAKYIYQHHVPHLFYSIIMPITFTSTLAPSIFYSTIMPNTYTSTLSLTSSIPPLCQIHLPASLLLTSSILPSCPRHIPAPSLLSSSILPFCSVHPTAVAFQATGLKIDLICFQLS